MLYIFKVNTGNGILTYTFHSESSGNFSNENEGIANFIAAFKKQYANCKIPATLRVMNENGLFYNPKTNKYEDVIDFGDVTIPLVITKSFN